MIRNHPSDQFHQSEFECVLRPPWLMSVSSSAGLDAQVDERLSRSFVKSSPGWFYVDYSNALLVAEFEGLTRLPIFIFSGVISLPKFGFEDVMF